ncbi:hypothetical protein ANN_21479 [Periplaneta americana]|uniref:Uncharacterized protein n=1 Tax=Periplaneta americana TaxID=6978 RepID=A0ABQ8SHA1_PERAM|nr:hypothetical protein ANN_21479 [Periplaneta americana]
MAGLYDDGNEPPGSPKFVIRDVETEIKRHATAHPNETLANISSAATAPAHDDILMILPEKNNYFTAYKQVVVITDDVQNVHLLLEYRPHIDVSLTCEHDPKLQEYCVCPQNRPQFDSEGIPNQAPETNKPMILNGPTSRNREGSDQVSVEAKQLGHLYISIDQETFDPSTGEPYD